MYLHECVNKDIQSMASTNDIFSYINGFCTKSQIQKYRCNCDKYSTRRACVMLSYVDWHVKCNFANTQLPSLIQNLRKHKAQRKPSIIHLIHLNFSTAFYFTSFQCMKRNMTFCRTFCMICTQTSGNYYLICKHF